MDSFVNLIRKIDQIFFILKKDLKINTHIYFMHAVTF
jgi:hypothetical protein